MERNKKGIFSRVMAFIALVAILGIFGVFGAGCGLLSDSGTSTGIGEKLSAIVDKISSAAASAWVNGGSTAASQAISTYVSNAQSSGDIDGTEASLITTAAPVLVSLLDSLAAQVVASSSTTTASAATETTTTTESSSKALVVKTRAVVNKDVLAAELAAKIKAKLEALIAALKSGKSIAPAKA